MKKGGRYGQAQEGRKEKGARKEKAKEKKEAQDEGKGASGKKGELEVRPIKGNGSLT